MDIRKPEEHLALLKMQKARLREFKDALCATEEDIQSVIEDADNLEAIVEHTKKSDHFVQVMEKIWHIVRYGLKEGETMPVQPEPPELIVPHPPLKNGMQWRTEVRNMKFRAAPGYTEEIGAALGIQSKKKSVKNGKTEGKS